MKSREMRRCRQHSRETEIPETEHRRPKKQTKTSPWVSRTPTRRIHPLWGEPPRRSPARVHASGEPHPGRPPHTQTHPPSRTHQLHNKLPCDVALLTEVRLRRRSRLRRASGAYIKRSAARGGGGLVLGAGRRGCYAAAVRETWLAVAVSVRRPDGRAGRRASWKLSKRSAPGPAAAFLLRLHELAHVWPGQRYTLDFMHRDGVTLDTARPCEWRSTLGAAESLRAVHFRPMRFSILSPEFCWSSAGDAMKRGVGETHSELVGH